MRVMLVTGEYPPAPGGVGDYTRRLVQTLLARGGEVVVVTAQTHSSAVVPHEEQLLDDPSTPLVLRLPTRWGWDALRKLRQTVQLVEPAVVHIQYQAGAYNQHPAITLLPAVLRARLPVVVTMHDLLLPYLFPKAGLLRRWFTHRLLRDTHTVIVTNDEDHSRLHGSTPRDRQHASARNLPCRLIPIASNIDPRPPTGFDPAIWRAEHGLTGAQVVGYFGLMNASKGIIELVHALHVLAPSVQLVIIGGAATTEQDRAYAAEVRTLIAQRGLAARVHWTGPCLDHEVSAHLLACDAVALPFTDGASYRRGSLLAALAHGCAIVTTRPRLPLNPSLEDSVAARLLPDASPATLATALNELLADRALRQRLGLGARALAAHFSWPAVAAAHEVVYNAAIR